MEFDIIFSGGTIIDGSNNKPFVADVGVVGDKISAVGDLSYSNSPMRIQIDDLVITPGFIDIHTHSDLTILGNPNAESQIHQGVTMEVIGQCGYSPAPLNGDPKELAKDTLGFAFGLKPSVDLNWNTFGQYLDHLNDSNLGINIMAMVGHGALYRAVCGEGNVIPDENQTKKMITLLEESLEAGAIGMSSGLEYWPGIIAGMKNLVDMCKIVRQHGGLHASHMRNRDIYYDMALSEILAICRNSGVPLEISHIQPKWGRPPRAAQHMVELIRFAQEDGVSVFFDLIPDEYSVTYVTACLPSWAFNKGNDGLIQYLQDPISKEKLKENPSPIWQLIPDGKWERIYVMQATQNKALVGKSMEEVGQLRKCDPHDAMLEMLLEEKDDLSNFYFTARNFFIEDLEFFMRKKECIIASDTISLAPYGVFENDICTPNGYGWVAEFLEKFIIKKNLLSPEDAIHRLTGLPAQRLNLKDRGSLRPGSYADIVVLDWNKVKNNCSFEKFNAAPTGIEHVMVNGTLEIKNGKRQDKNEGRVLRN